MATNNQTIPTLVYGEDELSQAAPLFPNRFKTTAEREQAQEFLEETLPRLITVMRSLENDEYALLHGSPVRDRIRRFLGPSGAAQLQWAFEWLQGNLQREEEAPIREGILRALRGRTLGAEELLVAAQIHIKLLAKENPWWKYIRVTRAQVKRFVSIMENEGMVAVTGGRGGPTTYRLRDDDQD